MFLQSTQTGSDVMTTPHSLAHSRTEHRCDHNHHHFQLFNIIITTATTTASELLSSSPHLCNFQTHRLTASHAVERMVRGAQPVGVRFIGTHSRTVAATAVGIKSTHRDSESSFRSIIGTYLHVVMCTTALTPYKFPNVLQSRSRKNIFLVAVSANFSYIHNMHTCQTLT